MDDRLNDARHDFTDHFDFVAGRRTAALAVCGGLERWLLSVGIDDGFVDCGDRSAADGTPLTDAGLSLA